MTPPAPTYLLPPATVHDWLETAPDVTHRGMPYGDFVVQGGVITLWPAGLLPGRTVEPLTRLPQPGDCLPIGIERGTVFVTVTAVSGEDWGDGDVMFTATTPAGREIVFNAHDLEAAGFVFGEDGAVES